jgi:RNA-directed DNA polymerase
MDPIVECVSDLDSYRFRKFRSPADAILAFCGKLSHPNASEYIYDVNIQGCFDNISYDFLLTEIRFLDILSRKSDLRIIKEWLKCGVMTTNGLEETHTGTPQGGIIS